MKEKVSLAVVRYYNKNNKKTCGLDFNKGLFCMFIRVRRFGTQEVCIFSEKPLERRDGYNTLIPHNERPVWEINKDENHD